MKLKDHGEKLTSNVYQDFGKKLNSKKKDYGTLPNMQVHSVLRN